VLGCRASGARQAPCVCLHARRVPRCRATQVVHDLEGCADAPAPIENGASEGTAPGAGAALPPNAPPRLSFYLDGAHTEESMATCAAWFAGAIGAADPRPDRGQGGGGATAASGDVQRVLLFNCMPARARPALSRAGSAGVIMLPPLWLDLPLRAAQEGPICASPWSHSVRLPRGVSLQRRCCLQLSSAPGSAEAPGVARPLDRPLGRTHTAR
jgi:hypothetical protein